MDLKGTLDESHDLAGRLATAHRDQGLSFICILVGLLIMAAWAVLRAQRLFEGTS